jgi:SAM-dependent methyltransferase
MTSQTTTDAGRPRAQHALPAQNLDSWEAAVLSLVDDPARRAEVEANYFDQPTSNAARRYARSEEWRAVRDIIGPARGVAVDVGAGCGIVSYALAQDGWRAVAVEPDPSEVVGAGAIRRLAAETGLVIDVRSGVGERLPLRDGEAALVIARQVLHHARDLHAFACEIARVLAPGGVLLSARDHVITGPEQLQAFLDGHALHRFYGGENAYTRLQYREAIEGAGLRIEREIGSFESVINYAPHTRETLRAEVARRFGPLGFAADLALRSGAVSSAVLKLLSAVDRRPGRHVSFVCSKT